MVRVTTVTIDGRVMRLITFTGALVISLFHSISIAYMTEEQLFLHIQLANMHMDNANTFLDQNNISAACREADKAVKKFYELKIDRDVPPYLKPHYNYAKQRVDYMVNAKRRVCG